MFDFYRSRAAKVLVLIVLVAAACDSGGEGGAAPGAAGDSDGGGTNPSGGSASGGAGEERPGGAAGTSGNVDTGGADITGSSGNGEGGESGQGGGASGSGGAVAISRVCGSPGIAALNAGKTFDQSNGHVDDSTQLIDWGASSAPIFHAGDRMLSATMYPDIGVAIGVAPDGWYLWDVPSGDRVATGQGALLDRKGPVFLVRVGVAEPTLEVRAVSDGHLLGSITPAGPHSFADEHGQGYCELPPCTLVGLATNGGYVWTRDPSGKLNTWLPDGTPSFAFSGDYRSVGFREIFASAARLAVAAGPAGANVVEYLNMTSGAQGSSSAFAGSFSFWFKDGSHFLTRASNQILRFYTPDVGLVSTINLPNVAPDAGYGDYFWKNDIAKLHTDIYGLDADPNNPVPALSLAANVFPFGNLLMASPGPLLTLVHLDGELSTETIPVPISPLLPATDGAGNWAIVDAWGALYYHGTVANSDAAGFLGCGSASAIAGSASGTAAVATRSGKVLVIDTTTRTVSEVLEPFMSSHLELSAEGTVLLGNGNPLGSYVYGQLDLDAYSLPGGQLIKRWSSPVTDFRLSANGTRVSRACSNQVTDVSGANALSLVPSESCSPPRLSPSGAHIATSSRDPYLDPPDGLKPPMTTIYDGAAVVDIVPGYALGWVDEHRLLVQSYSFDPADVEGGTGSYPAWTYLGTTIYSEQAQVLTTLSSLPNMKEFQVVSSSQILSLDDANIYDLATGASVFVSGAPPRCSVLVGSSDACSVGFAPPAYALAGSALLQADRSGLFLAEP